VAAALKNNFNFVDFAGRNSISSSSFKILLILTFRFIMIRKDFDNQSLSAIRTAFKIILHFIKQKCFILKKVIGASLLRNWEFNFPKPR
jgi:hypothetical protein